MKGTTQAFLVTIIGILGAVIFLGLTVYPFQYGFVESSILAGLIVLFSLFQFVLDEADI
ncbi:hypothetical protein [Haloterrigena salifodinae]|uniref:hypothetical protein n=1 Tax=Haloterrigena salifodinae TaxID=2675099 RepID=UPI0013DF8A5A|nr:hypothetical protein [Haloterrigena salifodinae]